MHNEGPFSPLPDKAGSRSRLSSRLFHIRTIILLALTTIMALHLLSSIPGIWGSYQAYQNARMVYDLNDISDHLFTAVGNYGFERGRVNVVLNDAGPMEKMADNREFIHQRRSEGDDAMEQALTQIRALNINDISSEVAAILIMQRQIEELRKKTEANLIRPIQEREKGLAPAWFSAMTKYIEIIKALLIRISDNISDADGLISRYSSIKRETLSLRNTTGPEMSILSATILSQKPLSSSLAEKVFSLQIRTGVHFQNLEALCLALSDPRIPEALAELKQIYEDHYVPYRDTILPETRKGGPYSYPQQDFLARGVEVLQQIAGFMKTIVSVTREYAETNVSAHRKKILVQTFHSLGSLSLILLIFFYVDIRVVKPIARVTSSVRRLANKDLDLNIPYQNDHNEVGEMARAVEVFRKMALRQRGDMEALQRAEEAIKKNEFRFRTVADFAYNWEYWLNPDGGFEYISPSCERITGYTPAEFSDSPRLLVDICLKEDKDILLRHLERESPELLQNQNFTFRIRKKTGEIRWISHICRSIVNQKGEYLGVRACNRDITEQKQLAEELILAKKLEATATLAGGIAHDFNNLLAALLGNIELAEDEIGDQEPAGRFLKEARKAGLRASDLTAKFITFSSGGVPRKQQTGIAAYLTENISLLLSGTAIRLETEKTENSLTVDIDHCQMNQVISAIITNAKEAMPEGGLIRLRISCATSADPDHALASLQPDSRYVVIDLEDTGPGIPEDIIGKVFDPYFSTKDMGTEKGMGMGLAISRSVLTKHNGAITIHSGKSGGTVVRLYLPLRAVPSGPVRENELTVFPSSDTGRRILVMDDEEIIRDLMLNILERYGYIAETAADGHEAVEKAGLAINTGTPFDLIIMDLTIPGGMGGVEAVKEVLKLDKHARVIVASGYCADPVMEQYQDYGFCGAIAKPFQMNDLLRLIRSC